MSLLDPFIISRIQRLRQLNRREESAAADDYNEQSEVARLVRLLRPNHSSADHTDAIRRRLRQNILNNPHAGSEGPLLLTQFDKTFDSFRRSYPILAAAALSFLKPLSFYAGPKPGHHLRQLGRVAEDERSLENPAARPSARLTSRTTFTHAEVAESIQPLQSAAPEEPMHALRNQRDVPLFAQDYQQRRHIDPVTATKGAPTDATSASWIAPEVEQTLLIDLVYVLQGVTAKYIHFDSKTETYSVNPNVLHVSSPSSASSSSNTLLPVAVTDAVLSICELGWLFQHIRRTLQLAPWNSRWGSTSSVDQREGLVFQAMQAAIQEELQDYYRLLAVLEQEILREGVPGSTAPVVRSSAHDAAFQRRLASFPGRNTSAGQGSGKVEDGSGRNGYGGLTLLRLKAWLQDPLERMCTLARILDSAVTLRGGALLTLLSAHLWMYSGDQRLSAESSEGPQLLLQRLLHRAAVPWDRLLVHWLVSGQLDDLCQEFFVRERKSLTPTTGMTTAATVSVDLWRERFMIIPANVPRYLSSSLAQQILVIGRGWHFLRLCQQHWPRDMPKVFSARSPAWKDYLRSRQSKQDRQRVKFSARLQSQDLVVTKYGQVVNKRDLAAGAAATPTAAQGDENSSHVTWEDMAPNEELQQALDERSVQSKEKKPSSGSTVSSTSMVTRKAKVVAAVDDNLTDDEDGEDEVEDEEEITPAELLAALEVFRSQAFRAPSGHDEDVSPNSTSTSTALIPATSAAGRLSPRNLVHLVHRLYLRINRRVLFTVEDVFAVSSHLVALKRFLLLGQGDFVLSLLEGLNSELNQRATMLSRHTLSNIVDGALRASVVVVSDTSQPSLHAHVLPPEIVDRVQVRLLEAATGDSGWEVFSLDYNTQQNPPLATLLYGPALTKYRVLFLSLWRLKRVEWTLTRTWKLSRAALHHRDWLQRRSLSKSGSSTTPLLLQTGSSADPLSVLLSGQVTTTTASASLEILHRLFHHCQLTRRHMLHFVRNVSDYLLCDVVDAAWQRLAAEVLEVPATSFEALLATHGRFLEDIFAQCWLAPEQESLQRSLQQVLQSILRFCSLEESLLADAMAMLARAKMSTASSPSSAGTTAKRGRKGARQQQDEDEDEDDEGVRRGGAGAGGAGQGKEVVFTLPVSLIQRLQQAVRDFHESVAALLTSLHDLTDHAAGGKEDLPDTERLRALLMRLDFNLYYQEQQAGVPSGLRLGAE